jgi:hypothetical protein
MLFAKEEGNFLCERCGSTTGPLKNCAPPVQLQLKIPDCTVLQSTGFCLFFVNTQIQVRHEPTKTCLFYPRHF